MAKTIELEVKVLDDAGNVVSQHTEEAYVIESREDLEELFGKLEESNK